MTLVVAWVRSTAAGPELILAADSRLTGNGNVDTCQKIFPLHRGDCAIGFSGDTALAYPYLHQVLAFSDIYKKSRDRALDVGDLRSRIVSVLNAFLGDHQDAVRGTVEKMASQANFLFVGWSWKKQAFRIFRLFFDIQSRRFRSTQDLGVWATYDRARTSALPVVWSGDFRGEFARRLRTILSQKAPLETVSLDMEPLVILTEMLTDPAFTDRRGAGRGLIGGAPQLVKIYPFLQAVPFAFFWGPQRNIYLLGRRLLRFEVTTNPIVDPMTLEITYPLDAVAN